MLLSKICQGIFSKKAIPQVLHQRNRSPYVKCMQFCRYYPSMEMYLLSSTCFFTSFGTVNLRIPSSNFA